MAEARCQAAVWHGALRGYEQCRGRATNKRGAEHQRYSLEVCWRHWQAAAPLLEWWRIERTLAAAKAKRVEQGEGG